MIKVGFKISLAVFALLLLSSCSLKKVATTTIGKIATDGAQVLESEQDIELARNSTPSLILTLEVFHKGNEKDKRLLTLLAKAYGEYAFGFLEEDLLRYKDTDKAAYQKSYDRADLFYSRGKKYGLDSLWSKREQEKILMLPQDEFERALGKFGKGRAASLFWAAFCWGNFINLHRDDPNIFIDVPRVEAMVRRVLALEPSFYYGSAHSFLGALSSSRPAMLGGNQKLSEEHFKAAIATDGNYLMHKVLYAQYYAVQFQDKNLFEQLLGEVRNADITKLDKDIRLANELAKRRVGLLITRRGDFF